MKKSWNAFRFVETVLMAAPAGVVLVLPCMSRAVYRQANGARHRGREATLLWRLCNNPSDVPRARARLKALKTKPMTRSVRLIPPWHRRCGRKPRLESADHSTDERLDRGSRSPFRPSRPHQLPAGSGGSRTDIRPERSSRLPDPGSFELRRDLRLRDD